MMSTYKDVQLFIEQKQHTLQWAKNPTRYNAIETKHMLEYIYGGRLCYIWCLGLLKKKQMENLILEYKKGKFLEKLLDT